MRFERLALISEVRARDAQALLRAAQLEIVARDLGRDEHLRVAQIGRRGVGVRGRSLDAAAHAAEQIELPERREPGVVALDVDARRSLKPGCCALLSVRATSADRAGPTVAPRARRATRAPPRRARPRS